MRKQKDNKRKAPQHFGAKRTKSAAIDGSSYLANKGNQQIMIEHVPSGFAVNFKAMMTAFNDSYKAEWDSENAFGRMDPIQSYKQTTRTISLGFTVAAADYDEAVSNLQRVSALIQFLYPTYDANGLISNSPLCTIEFMNWASGRELGDPPWVASNKGLLGTIDGFTFEPDLDAGVYQWDPSSAAGGVIYPKILNVSFSFIVLHQPNSMGWFNDRPINPAFPYGVGIEEFAGLDGDAVYGDFTETITKIQEETIFIPEKKKATKAQMTCGGGQPCVYGPVTGRLMTATARKNLEMKRKKLAMEYAMGKISKRKAELWGRSTDRWQYEDAGESLHGRKKLEERYAGYLK